MHRVLGVWQDFTASGQARGTSEGPPPDFPRWRVGLRRVGRGFSQALGHVGPMSRRRDTLQAADQNREGTSDAQTCAWIRRYGSAGSCGDDFLGGIRLCVSRGRRGGLLEGEPTRRPPATSEATAFVLIQEPDASAPGTGLSGSELAAENAEPAPIVARPDPLRIRRQVLGWADEAQRDRLRVETTAEALRGRWRIAITLRDTPADLTVRSVNTLAQSCAESYRSEWKSSVERAYEEAHAVSERLCGAASRGAGTVGRIVAAADRSCGANPTTGATPAGRDGRESRLDRS